jgi:hypothetical protein
MSPYASELWARHPEGSGSDPRDLGNTNGFRVPEIPRPLGCGAF